jgi:transcription elongation factor Elf1
VGLLTCTRCNIEKPSTLEFFPPHNKKSNGLDSWCRDCRNSYRKETRVPQGVVDITKALEAKNLAECIICGKETSVVIDHDHKTGDVRGGLCSNCNLGLGHFKDDPELLRLAALYLEGKCACGNCEPYWGGKQEIGLTK